MNITFTKSFAKDLRKISDPAVLKPLQEVIKGIELAEGLQNLKHLKKISSVSGYYRLRLGDYRLGMIIDGDNVNLVRILHRKDIYRYFP